MSNNVKKILSIDSGASNIRIVIFDELGNTIFSDKINEGANIAVDRENCTKQIIKVLSESLNKASLSYEDINHFSIGVAGISDESARELLFKRLEECKISNRTHLTTDVNPIFEMNCSDNSAILVSVGTGAICLGRNIDDKIEKVGGAGLDIDLGSGFWMGKELLIKLSFNKNEEHDESEFNDLLNMTLNSFNTNELNLGIDQVMQSNDRYRKIASLSSGILELGENGNEIAISIIQQSSQHIADMILFLCDQISYINDELILIANGSIMNNEFYRKSLSDALIFDFSSMKWLFPNISSAYYPGLLSAKMLGMKVTINDLIENGAQLL